MRVLSADIPRAAIDRWESLAAEEEIMRKAENGQIGTQVPKVFYDANNVIINPSNVGSNILSRMATTDDSVWSALTFMVLMIVSKIGEYHHDDEKIKAYVHRFLKRLRNPTWSQSMEAMCSHKLFGFSTSEIMFGLNKDFQKVPIRIATYHPSTMAFEVDSSGMVTPNGVLQYVLQYSQYANPNQWWTAQPFGWKVQNPFTTPVDRMIPARIPFVHNYGLVRIPRKKVIHHVGSPLFSFGSPYGATAVRTAHLAWQLKVFLMKQMGIAGKRNATNALWATAPMGANKVEYFNPETRRKEFLTPTEAMRVLMADRESDDAIVTGPEKDGYSVTTLQNIANLTDFTAAINFCDVKIFRCFLIPSLVMTDGSAGNRSLGDKHFDIVDRISTKESAQFGETLVNDMIERNIVENFGEQEDYGHFTQRPQSIEERKELCEMFVSACNGGIMKPYMEADMSYMRTSLGMPQDKDKSLSVDGSDFARAGQGGDDTGQENAGGKDPAIPDNQDAIERDSEDLPAVRKSMSRSAPKRGKKSA
ncbi:MAG: hypothetical protein P4M11_06730 [Candidatus Pacebacteria bacterium]|nr:hypothetical protein [Candidatus Paceibacterota bacterium]